MKPVLFEIAKTEKEAVRILKEDYPYFYDSLHYHTEMQVMVILEGEGTYFIGDAIGQFGPGDIFILGSDLPHFFRSAPPYYAANSSLRSKNISILFSPETLFGKLMELPEFHALKSLLQHSKRGLNVKGKTREQLYEMAKKIAEKEGAKRIIYLLKLLDQLTESNELIPMSHIPFGPRQGLVDTKKINVVIRYIMENYSKDITLTDTANMANLSINAFCRFFKQHTRKTFSQFLNEIRIGHACKLLIEESYSVKEVAFDAGYSNISYFNRQFKLITGFTPSAYLRAHAKKITP